MSLGDHHGGGNVWWREDVLMADWKQRKREHRNRTGKDIAPNDTSPMTYFLQLGLICYFLPPPRKAIILNPPRD
jgi:hypothetical protein